jgi:hypothetical protein
MPTMMRRSVSTHGTTSGCGSHACELLRVCRSGGEDRARQLDARRLYRTRLPHYGGVCTPSSGCSPPIVVGDRGAAAQPSSKLPGSVPFSMKVSDAIISLEEPTGRPRAVPDQMYGIRLSFPWRAGASHSHVPYTRVKTAIGNRVEASRPARTEQER